MASTDSTNRSAVHSDLALQAQSVDAVLKDSLYVTFALKGTQLVAAARFRLTVASVVPTHHIDLTSEEEVEPVSIGRSDHLLVH